MVGKRILALVAALVALTAAAAAAAQEPQEELQAELRLPAGLSSFLQARVLEAEGMYRLALEEYAKSLEASPEEIEVRVRYAALLLDMGLADKAAALLEDVNELDWYGKRTRALALAQLGARETDLLPAAEEALREVVEERTSDANMLLNLAQVVQRQGRLTEAEEIVAELREKRSTSPQLIAYHGSLLRALGRAEEAAGLYGRCVDGLATAATCRENLVDLLVELGRPAQAGATMLQWLSDDDLDLLVQAAALLAEGGRTSEAVAVVRRVLRIEPSSPSARVLEARLLAGLGRYGEAAASLQQLIRKDRKNLDLLLSLAWVQSRLARIDEARETVDDALAVASKSDSPGAAVRCYLAAADIELEGGSPLRAREWLERVDDPQEGGRELVHLLAQSYRRSGNWGEGMAAMLRLQPRIEGAARAEAMAFEAEFRLRMGDSRGRDTLQPLLRSSDPAIAVIGVQVLQAVERWEDVADATATALERMPGRRDLRFARAAALERLGRVDEAAEIFQGLLAENPRDAASANYLGYMWADANVNLEAALGLIGTAVEVEPDNPAFLDSLGWVHYRLGNLAQAEQWLRQAMSGGGIDGTVLAHVGEVLLALGDTDEAARYLRRALDLGCEEADHVQTLLEDIAGE